LSRKVSRALEVQRRQDRRRPLRAYLGLINARIERMHWRAPRGCLTVASARPLAADREGTTFCDPRWTVRPRLPGLRPHPLRREAA
jgi:hypothetical protein